MSDDPLGDRMKLYEGMEAQRRFLPMLPVVARLDGKCFSRFTTGLERPYDVRLSKLMVAVTTELVKLTNACCGYTQSDEITLGWYSSDQSSQIYFDGRIQKMNSVLAAECSVRFLRLSPDFLPDRYRTGPVFDCRVWQLPTLAEATNAFLWREFDATKNSISMAAQAYYSHKELFGKHTGEMQEMLFQKDVNWNDYPAFFKRGSYVQRRKVSTPLSPVELESLPPKHNARKNPDLLIERTEYRRIEMPPLSSVTNRIAAIFEGAEPQTAQGAQSC